MDSHTKAISRDAVLAMLDDLGRRLTAKGIVGEIALYGGSALMLLYEFRQSTCDVDYVHITGNPIELEAHAKETAEKFGVPADWLNSSVEAFASDFADHRFFGDFPRTGKPGLRVFIASPEYLLAMKMMAMRNPVETMDFKDVWDLADRCGVTTAEEAKIFVEKFYPRKLSRKNTLLIEDLFADKAAGKPYSPAIGWK